MSIVVIRRLGVQPFSIDASHSPFLSKPHELARLLIAAASSEPRAALLPS
jgi:hypothetical protein